MKLRYFFIILATAYTCLGSSVSACGDYVDLLKEAAAADTIFLGRAQKIIVNMETDAEDDQLGTHTVLTFFVKEMIKGELVEVITVFVKGSNRFWWETTEMDVVVALNPLRSDEVLELYPNAYEVLRPDDCDGLAHLFFDESSGQNLFLEHNVVGILNTIINDEPLSQWGYPRCMISEMKGGRIREVDIPCTESHISQ